jgi:hypothetical protein
MQQNFSICITLEVSIYVPIETFFLAVHAKHEHLEKESHVIWIHLETRLETSQIAQVLENLVLSLNVLTDTH